MLEDSQMKTETIPFEQAAEHRTGLEGWVCKTCHRFWGVDERTARWCCATDLECDEEGCATRVRKGGFTVCVSCADKRALAQWTKLTEVPWDGTTPLCLHDHDMYFFSPDDLDYYLDEHEGLTIESLRLVVCEPSQKPDFSIMDFLEDYLPEDGHDVGDPAEIEKQVNQWIKENAPTVWYAGETRPTLESVKPHVSV